MATICGSLRKYGTKLHSLQKRKDKEDNVPFVVMCLYSLDSYCVFQGQAQGFTLDSCPCHRRISNLPEPLGL
jgi:hypothetical protein